MKKSKAYGAAASLTVGIALSAGSAFAAPICSEDVRVLAQPRQGLDLLEKSADEFKALSGASFHIDYLNENDRRAKSRADASTVGKYNVYYIDEANVALFAKSKWVLPLLDYYPKEYDFADFDEGRQKVATYEGKIYFAPLTGGGDLMVYRKDLLDKAGLQPPKTLDELIADVKKLNDPDHGVYGIGLRGQRGSGANVWRWMPYFKAFGGQWFDGDKPAFDSEAAVKATEVYLDLFKYSAPGTKTGSWDEDTGAFLAGQVAILIESSPLGGEAVDPRRSKVVGKINMAATPKQVKSGPAIGTFIASVSAGAKNPQGAVQFLEWFTSSETQLEFARKYGGAAVTGSALSDPEAVEKHRWLPAIADAVNNSVEKPRTPDEPKMEDILGTALNEALVEAIAQKSNYDAIAQKHLSDAADQITAYLKQQGGYF